MLNVAVSKWIQFKPAHHLGPGRDEMAEMLHIQMHLTE